MYIDVDIEIDEIYDSLSTLEKKDLVVWLQEEGYLDDYVKIVDHTNHELGTKLSAAHWRMSVEDIEAIQQILNKY